MPAESSGFETRKDTVVTCSDMPSTNPREIPRAEGQPGPDPQSMQKRTYPKGLAHPFISIKCLASPSPFSKGMDAVALCYLTVNLI